MLEKRYVECEIEKRKRSVITDENKFAELKRILKTYADDIGDKLSLFADPSISVAGRTRIKVNNHCSIHVISLSVENPLLAEKTGQLTVCLSFVEEGEEKIFSEYIFLNNQNLRQFRSIIRTLSSFAGIEKRRPAARVQKLK